ncbi:hypothetical protein [Sphingobacterium kyonggiense]
MRLYKPLAYLGFIVVFLAAIFCPFLKVPIKGNWNLYQVDFSLYVITNGLLGLSVLFFFIRKLAAFRFVAAALFIWTILSLILVYLQINNYFGIKLIDGLLAKTLHLKWGWVPLILGALLLFISVRKTKHSNINKPEVK